MCGVAPALYPKLKRCRAVNEHLDMPEAFKEFLYASQFKRSVRSMRTCPRLRGSAKPGCHFLPSATTYNTSFECR